MLFSFTRKVAAFTSQRWNRFRNRQGPAILFFVTTTKLLKITGLVQGVYYRESMRQEALRLGVTGWVRNRKDGSVEALVQGEESLVQDLLNWCAHGPARARVDHVAARDVPAETALRDFLRRETE